MTERILFLPHRIPFPPDKGDKVRSYHILRYLAERAEVFLGSFVDDPDDWAHERAVREHCVDARLAPLAPGRARLRALSALASGRPLTVAYYADGRLSGWIRDLARRRAIDRVLAFSSSMAQYAWHVPAARREIDFVDIDSDKWAQYAERHTGVKRWIYRREARSLGSYEHRVAGAFDASYFVSREEADAFRERWPDVRDRVGHVDNGVSTDYFDPGIGHQNPYPEIGPVLVFTGAMDYWPNVDAVTWFARGVLPAIRDALGSVTFYVVGRNPPREVSALGSHPGVRVTGAVADVRPYLQSATAAVAPIRVARGVQNKVLEAMAMARPVICSPSAHEGIRARPGSEILVAREPGEYLDHLRRCLSGEYHAIGPAARALVERAYAWSTSLAPLMGSTRPEPETASGGAFTPLAGGAR